MFGLDIVLPICIVIIQFPFRSLGLHIVPKLRFIKRTEKLHNASKDIEGDSVGESDGQSEDHLARQSKTGDERLGPQIEDDSSDEDEDNLFTVTKTELPLDLDESEPAVPVNILTLALASNYLDGNVICICIC